MAAKDNIMLDDEPQAIRQQEHVTIVIPEDAQAKGNVVLLSNKQALALAANILLQLKING